MTDRQRLIEIIGKPICILDSDDLYGAIADHLLENGVVVPPCKVGDTVYCLDDIVWDDECRHCEHYLIGGFGDPSECNRTKYGFKHPDCIKITEEVITQEDIFYYLYAKAFGKTVFLTYEEAEKALEERQEGISNDQRRGN